MVQFRPHISGFRHFIALYILFLLHLLSCSFPFYLFHYFILRHIRRIPKRDREVVNVFYIFLALRTWLNLEVWKIKADHFFCVTN